MPAMSTIRQFVEALQTRQTTSTRALKALWNARALESALVTALPTMTLTPLDPLLRQALKTRGNLNDSQVDHIAKWPLEEKTTARDAVVTALQSSPVRGVQFYWDLHGEAGSMTKVDNLTGPGDIIITFLSPRANLRVDSTFNLGEVVVDVP